ncbi:MAG TPA: ribonuclease HII [Clostridia bacterium]|nr:ribonuclease HII [Clostridia bacterium]
MARLNEQARLYAFTETERGFWARGALPAGMDEVGRGPLAGPVVAACVVLPPEPLIGYVNDSKKLTALRREQLAPIIKDTALAYGFGWVFQEEIDRINILNATKKAFCLAYRAMGRECADALVDAVAGLDIPAAQHPIVHGDALSYLIGAASVIAKVERDAYMTNMHELYPHYGFDRNKGYGTAEHIAAIREYGPCPLHRRSFLKGILEGV